MKDRLLTRGLHLARAQTGISLSLAIAAMWMAAGLRAGPPAWADTRPQSPLTIPLAQVVLIPAPVKGVLDVVEQLQIDNPAQAVQDIVIPLPDGSRSVQVARDAGAPSPVVAGGGRSLRLPHAAKAQSHIRVTVTYQLPYSAARGAAFILPVPYDASIVRLFVPEGGWFVSAPGLLGNTQSASVSGSLFRVYTRTNLAAGRGWPVRVLTMPSPERGPQTGGLPVLGRTGGTEGDMPGAITNLVLVALVLAIGLWGVRRQREAPARPTPEEALLQVRARLIQEFECGQLSEDEYTARRAGVERKLSQLRQRRPAR